MATGNSEPFFNNMQNLNAAGVGAFTFNLRFPGQYYDPNSVTLATAPGIPTIGTAIAGNGQASVAFTPPTSNGGSSITNYTATSNPGGLTGTGLTSPILVTGLTNGTAYTFTITATNAVGTSLPSSASNSIIPAISTVFYIHTDQLDTPRQITDSNGNLVWQWDNSDPFGNNVANQNPSGQGTFSFNLRFPGQYYDQENNTHYNINRDYDPSIGRYIQSDPIGLAGGSFSTYIYVGNNPISFIDPLGLHTTVVINNNDPLIGTHAGVVIGSGNSAALYDPGGSYHNNDKGSGDALYGNSVKLNDYVNYQKNDGPNVQTYTFNTTPSEEAAIYARIESNGSRGPGFCAADTSKALNGIGPFNNLGTYATPRGLGQALSNLLKR